MHSSTLEVLLSGHSITPPPIPTREHVCGIRMSFQGLTITTKQYGTQPWFDPAYQSLVDPVDRAAVRQQKKAAGDTHQIIGFTTLSGPVYPAPDTWLYHAISPSFEQHPQQFLDLIKELRQDDLIPIVDFDGDQGDLPLPYPGYENALRQLPILVDLLGPWNQHVLYARFYDDVFYGSSPEHIQNFGTQFRKLLPDGYLAIEHNTGHIPVGGGPSDYAPGGRMVGYDVICSEFNGPSTAQWRATPHNNGYYGDQIWMIASRLLGPAYVRPPEEPVWWDPHPPWYLATPSPRGPYFTCAMEWTFPSGAYNWVRNHATPSEAKADRDYFKSIGYTYTG